MESTAIYRKPKKWIAAALGLLIQPAGMLYVARPGWAAAYFVLALIVVLGNLFVLRERESAGNAIALLVAIICAMALPRSEEHTSELQSLTNLVCRLLLEKKKRKVTDCETRTSV